MKFLHEAPTTKENLVKEITNWYQLMIDTKGKKTIINDSCIGKISNSQVNVKLEITDEAGNNLNVYITPKNWWVKKLHKGQSTGFTKSVMEYVESFVNEEA